MHSPELERGLSGALRLQEHLVLGRSQGRLILRSPEQELILSDQLRYLPRLGRDELVDGQLRWKIECGEREAICELIARHRLALPAEEGSNNIPEHCFSYQSYPWWAQWLHSWLHDGELLLTTLRTGERKEIRSAYEERESVEPLLVWTSARCELVSMGRLGDFEAQPLSVDLAKASAFILDGEHELSAARRYRETLRGFAALQAGPQSYWKLGVVLKVAAAEGQGVARALSEQVGYRDDPLLHWCRPLWSASLEPGLADLPDLPDPVRLLDLWDMVRGTQTLALTPPEAIEPQNLEAFLATLCLQALRAHRAFSQPWPAGAWFAQMAQHWPAARQSELVAMFDQLSELLPSPARGDSLESCAAAQCVLTVLYQKANARERASACMQRLLDELPAVNELELFWGEEGEHSPLRHLMDILSARQLGIWPIGAKARASILALRAELHPISEKALAQWLASPELDESLRLRVRALHEELLRIRSNASVSTAQLPGKIHNSLSTQQIDTQLSHPAARSSHAASFQALLAKIEPPDHLSLKKYCDPGKEALLRSELHLAADLFGKDAPDLFLSRGEHSIGMQVHQGEPSFLLVGGEHRDPQNPAFLTVPELRFALGAELAHLYLGHSRVTSQQVWSGALDKGKATLDVLSGLVPLLGSFPWGQRLGRWTGFLDNKLLSGSVRKLREYFGQEQGDVPELTLDRSVGLIAAHRMMQLSADRAGLLLSGSFEASILAMWKLRPQSLSHLEGLRSEGLAETLQRMNEGGVDAWRALSCRAGALAVFYWSEEYRKLRRWVWGTKA